MYVLYLRIVFSLLHATFDWSSELRGNSGFIPTLFLRTSGPAQVSCFVHMTEGAHNTRYLGQWLAAARPLVRNSTMHPIVQKEDGRMKNLPDRYRCGNGKTRAMFQQNSGTRLSGFIYKSGEVLDFAQKRRNIETRRASLEGNYRRIQNLSGFQVNLGKCRENHDEVEADLCAVTRGRRKCGGRGGNLTYFSADARFATSAEYKYACNWPQLTLAARNRDDDREDEDEDDGTSNSSSTVFLSHTDYVLFSSFFPTTTNVHGNGGREDH